jgi:membrane dipeptidase
MDSPRVFDGHNDTLLDLHVDARGGGRSFFERSRDGHVDLPRALAGNYAGGCFAVFVPNADYEAELVETADGYAVPLAPAVEHERAKSFTYDVLADLYRVERQSRDRAGTIEPNNGDDGSGDGDDLAAFRVARTAADVREGVAADDVVVALAHLEGAAAVAPDLGNLDLLYAAGVRSLGLVWSRPNAFGEGVPFAYPRTPDTGGGLTDAGRDLVAACNDRGIVVDLAHATERTFFDTAAVTTGPLVVSHTAAHAICPSTRNLTDEQLDAVADTDGVIGIAFCAENLDPDGDQDTDLPLSVVVDHVAYVADRVGVDHVAIGSDFDGATVPDSVGDVTGLPALFDALRDRGFTAADCRAVAHENWLRVLDATL